MTPLQSWLRTIALCAFCGVVGWSFYQWGKAAPDLAPTLAAMNQSIAHLNPVITNANTAFKNLADATGDWSDSSKAQARDVRALLSAGGRTLDAVTEDAHAVKPAIESVQTTSEAATGVLAQAQVDLVSLNAPIKSLNPLILNAGDAVDDLDALLKDRAVHQTLDNLADTTGSVKGLSSDLAFYAHPILNPDPCKTKKCTFGRVMTKVGAYAGFGANVGEAVTLFHPLHVKVIP
jgi:hypothetical protein